MTLHRQAEQRVADGCCSGVSPWRSLPISRMRGEVVASDLAVIPGSVGGGAVDGVILPGSPGGEIGKFSRDHRMPKEGAHAGADRRGVVGVGAVIQQQQPAGAHRVHGAQDGADVARVLGRHQRYQPGMLARG